MLLTWEEKLAVETAKTTIWAKTGWLTMEIEDRCELGFVLGVGARM